MDEDIAVLANQLSLVDIDWTGLLGGCELLVPSSAGCLRSSVRPGLIKSVHLDVYELDDLHQGIPRLPCSHTHVHRYMYSIDSIDSAIKMKGMKTKKTALR